MKSRAKPSFWRAYNALPDDVQREARAAHRLWRQTPFHPTLHFKQLSGQPGLWSVRINNRGYRALGVRDGDVVTWLFIGTHDDYMRVVGSR